MVSGGRTGCRSQAPIRRGRQTVPVSLPPRSLPLRRLALLLCSLSLAGAIRVTITSPTPAPAAPLRPAPVAPPPARPVPDPLYPQQWNLPQIHLEEAWAQESGAPVTVALLDTGYAPSPELGARAINGYDFVSDPRRSGDGDGRDPDATGVGPLAYHAEAIANLIAAARDGRGIVGINPQARILHLRVAGADGLIDPRDLADALRWAAGLGVPGLPANRFPARVLNLSLYVDFIPLTGCDPQVGAAIREVTARGALVIAGAANDGKDASGYTPAGCDGVLTVTATNRSGTRPAYANWGPKVALAAPGGDPAEGVPLLSGGELRGRNGTSFAAPQVAGVASLMLGLNPRLTPARLTDLLKRSATPFPGGSCDPQNRAHSCGTGLLNAGAALRLAAMP